jgi:perosamine synthetase
MLLSGMRPAGESAGTMLGGRNAGMLCAMKVVEKPSPIPVFRPGFGAEELRALQEVFASGWLGPGPRSAKFEEAFAEFVGARHAVAVTSGTAALHLACRGLGLGPGDEVLVPSLTFVSTAHAPVYCGADVTFVDVDPETRTMDPEDLSRKVSDRSRAVIPMHYGGHPCRMEEILEIARRRGLAIIEDAAHACGALYRDRRVGGLEGTAATCFSFNALKNLSTGDGGMVTTDSPELADRIRRLRWMGIEKSTFERTAGSDDGPRYQWYYEVRDLGFKYIMNDVTAAVGLVQLGKLEGMQAARRRMALRYRDALKGVRWLDLPVEREYARSAWHLFTIRTSNREALRRHLQERGIATSVHYLPLHLQPYYRKRGETSLPRTEELYLELLSLPFHPNLEDGEIDRVVESILSFLP